MSSPFRTLLVAAAIGACTLAPMAHAAVVYSLANDGSQLIRFDTATPGAVNTVGAITAMGTALPLDGLDFRPANGLLYGYSNATGSVYTVDTSSGAANLVATLNNRTNTNMLGIDFNPVPDRLRIVTESDQNLRANLAGGATTVDGPLSYAATDVNANVNPQIIDAAYTNSDNDPATGTVLYYVDYGTNSLVTTSNPNGGVLNTVGMLGFDIDANTGFDILTVGGINTAYASFRVNGVNGLYTINLGSGAATLIGAIGEASLLYGLAVAPEAVPEPGSLALVGLAGLAAFGARRRVGR